MRYSVIVPVYNGEETIGRCLDSLLNQHYDDMEILLINDGSTDGTDAICSQYEKMYSEIHYFSKENGGVSSARNVGLKNAIGRYILFVDSDDYVSGNYFDALDRSLSESPADLVVFSWTTVSDASSKDNVLKAEIILGAAIPGWTENAMQNGSFGSLWSKVFLGDIIRNNKLFFSESLRIAEDWSFIFRYILFIDCIQTLSVPLYMVSLENGESLSRKARNYLCDQLFEANQDMRQTLDGRNNKALSRRFSRPLALSHFRSVYSASKELRKFPLSASERRKRIREYCSHYAGGRIKPVGLKCWCMAIPVYLRLAGIIDGLCSR